MTAPIEVSPTSADAVPDAVLAGVGGQAIQGRSLGQIAWMRLRRDKVAMAGGVIVLLLVLVAVVGPYLVQNPDTYHGNLINSTFSRPNGPFGGISRAHPLGVEPLTGRDMLARTVVGAGYSLMIGFLATVLAVIVGVLLGIVAGYSGAKRPFNDGTNWPRARQVHRCLAFLVLRPHVSSSVQQRFGDGRMAAPRSLVQGCVLVEIQGGGGSS